MVDIDKIVRSNGVALMQSKNMLNQHFIPVINTLHGIEFEYHKLKTLSTLVILLSPADFFQINFSKKFFQEALTECQTVWIQIRTNILSVLIWVQTVCKGYQQTTKVDASEERVKNLKYLPF